MIAQAAIAALSEHAMSEVQRLGQEIEQKPVRLQCVTCGTVYADGVPPQVTQPEQEPVAWMWRVKDFCDWPNWSVSLKRPADSGHAQYPRTEGYEDIPLYTTPPQRTEPEPDELNIAYMSGLYDGKKKRPWVGLTDDEYFALQMKIKTPMTTVQDYIDAMRMIEQALKERNQ
jgi:hypothetical protein